MAPTGHAPRYNLICSFKKMPNPLRSRINSWNGKKQLSFYVPWHNSRRHITLLSPQPPPQKTQPSKKTKMKIFRKKIKTKPPTNRVIEDSVETRLLSAGHSAGYSRGYTFVCYHTGGVCFVSRLTDTHGGRKHPEANGAFACYQWYTCFSSTFSLFEWCSFYHTPPPHSGCFCATCLSLATIIYSGV